MNLARAHIDLNCDAGEHADAASRDRDARLAAIVTSLNIACAGHAGDEGTIRSLLRAACALTMPPAIGAHPGYPDRANFGRVSLAMSEAEIERDVREQVSLLAALAREHATLLRHVKPHGALYHDAATTPAVARAIARAAASVDPRLVLVGMPGSGALREWRAMGVPVAREAFADRRYEPDGTLRSRTLPGSLVENPREASSQAASIACDGRVTTPDGTMVPLGADTICVHSDTPGAIELASAVRAALEARGVLLTALRHNGPERPP